MPIVCSCDWTGTQHISIDWQTGTETLHIRVDRQAETGTQHIRLTGTGQQCSLEAPTAVGHGTSVKE